MKRLPGHGAPAEGPLRPSSLQVVAGRQPQGGAGARSLFCSDYFNAIVQYSLRARHCSTRCSRRRCASPTSRSSRARRSWASRRPAMSCGGCSRSEQVDGPGTRAIARAFLKPTRPGSSRPTSPSTPIGEATCSSSTAIRTRTWRGGRRGTTRKTGGPPLAGASELRSRRTKRSLPRRSPASTRRAQLRLLHSSQSMA